MISRRSFVVTLAMSSVALGLKAETNPARVRSKRSGPWSSASTWENNELPSAGSIVEILPQHTIQYDIQSNGAFRMVHVNGTLSFVRDRDTRLDVGLLKIGGDSTEDGANCSSHGSSGRRPTLEVGTQDDPIPAVRTALIRLVYFDGSDKDTLPSVVCCGGKMDFHGAPLNRTWLKLGAPVKKGDTQVTLSEPVTGWRPGDRIIITSTSRQIPAADKPVYVTVRDSTETEERFVKSANGATVVLDRPAQFDHICDGPYRGDVANLSRNVIVESGTPEIQRGHTMYHHGSAGSISYAEFRHLGKEGVLGRYSVHFHLVRDSMRGSSVVGASIWDSGNRWMTLHGTDYLVVRDCVGYHSIGHGFFLEDGTEVFNVFDRNLAVQGISGLPLPNQVLPFDHNSGSGFWFANSQNTFTRNVACDCDVYGFRFDMQKAKKFIGPSALSSVLADFDPVLPVAKADGSRHKVDVRTLPFVRFEDNESHCQRNHALDIGGLDINLEGGCDGVGPDAHHPFIVKNMRVWDSHWAFHPFSPSILVDNFDIHNTAYGLWKPAFDKHVYRNMHMENIIAHLVLDARGELIHGLPDRNMGPVPVFDLNTAGAAFPKPLDPVDDLAPITVVTYISKPVNGKVTLRGTTQDCGAVKQVQVNGSAVEALRPDFAEWEVSVEAPTKGLTVHAEDMAGNVESQKVAYPFQAAGFKRA